MEAKMRKTVLNKTSLTKTIVTLAASAALCLTMLPSAASARGGHGGGGGGMGMHGGMGVHGGMGMRGGMSGGWRGNAVAFHSRGFSRDHDRFTFRHHGFRHFRDGIFVASYVDDDCYIARRVWTPYGWHWRRIWACG